MPGSSGSASPAPPGGSSTGRPSSSPRAPACSGSTPPPIAGPLECHDRFHDEYGVATESGNEAILACARLEGVLLDPIYTGKSMAGLFALAREGALDPSVPVVFLHTGGLPILFAFDEQAYGTSPVTRIP
ncbi:MAG: pyridoxal-phosphate dependent enzyme [Holophagales bacterium]|nr:pyridoxal-phosphate dependent enzyme [Holophagales bacterium]